MFVSKNNELDVILMLVVFLGLLLILIFESHIIKYYYFVVRLEIKSFERIISFNEITIAYKNEQRIIWFQYHLQDLPSVALWESRQHIHN